MNIEWFQEKQCWRITAHRTIEQVPDEYIEEMQGDLMTINLQELCR